MMSPHVHQTFCGGDLGSSMTVQQRQNNSNKTTHVTSPGYLEELDPDFQRCRCGCPSLFDLSLLLSASKANCIRFHYVGAAADCLHSRLLHNKATQIKKSEHLCGQKKNMNWVCLQHDLGSIFTKSRRSRNENGWMDVTHLFIDIKVVEVSKQHYILSHYLIKTASR